MDLPDHLNRIRDVLEDRVADHRIKVIVVHGNVMDWRIYVYIIM